MRLKLLVAAGILSASLAARADTLFNVSGSFTFGGTLSGTVTINTTDGDVTDGNLAVTDSTIGSFSFDSVPANQLVDMGQVTDEFDSGSSELSLVFDTGSLIGYAGGDLADSTGVADSVGFALLSDGQVTLPASASITPEPSSFLLLGTGLLGIAGVMRKRFA